ncbi:MAG TPA: response regulator transcription factor [Erysipelotrichaceae bacterium]|jgi:two-component system alkaline phosphatase synthesis response regulator PhoP|nr:response regulator transcription factor [Erysipelotrichia bacterium]HPX32302.1 response regulator transcription factor [Erysipelotrichaceae bacterium]HQA84813.1 response regulator transcription factor [Erysipelotrichaceae bacterium]
MIWCVDDDNTIREIEVYTLTQTGFEARGFADGISMLEALKTEKPDLIVLDIMLPGKDGIEVLKEIRRNPETREIPVIMATAKGEEMDKILGLDMGADDYLVKPFGVMEMVSRIKAVLRRYQPIDKEEILYVGEIMLNDKEHLVTVAKEKVELTYKEYELLKLFMSNPGIVFSREKLLSEVWGIDYLGESRTVDMHIKNLRQKLKEQGSRIETIIGVGYRLEGKK